MRILVTGSAGHPGEALRRRLRIGTKVYHAQVFSDGPYPVEPSA